MKWIIPAILFFAATIACAQTVVTKTITDGEDDHRPPDFCRNTPNPYARESCEQIRQSDRIRNNPHDENNMTTVTQKKTVEPVNSNPMPAWQKALQPPGTSNNAQDPISANNAQNSNSTTTTIIQKKAIHTDIPASNNTMPSWQKSLQP
jgi:hypothetical protein